MSVTTSDPAVRLLGAAPDWLRWVYRANLIAQVGIVLTGGLVRVTGSGLGCPTWPECVDGSITPTSEQTQAWHKYIEFGNRTLTGVLMLLALASVVGTLAWRRSSGVRRRRILQLAWVPVVGTLAQAVLGGVTVLMALNPLTVAAHLLLSIAVIAGCVALVEFAGDPTDPPGRPIVRPITLRMANGLIVVTGLVIVMGTIVTGSGPHAGDAATPRLAIDPRLISWLHADVVLLFIGLLIGMLALVHVERTPPVVHRRARAVVAAAVLQAALGYVQYFTGLPWAAVAAHMLGACLVWIAVWRLRFALADRSAAANDAGPRADRAAVSLAG